MSRAQLTVQQIDDPSLRLEARTQVNILKLVAEQLGDDFLGFHMARSFDLREIGLVYYVMASSEQLADALRNCERYSKINNEGVRLSFRLDRAASIGLEYVDIDRRSDRHQLEFWLVTLIRICRQVTDNRLAPRQIKVRHFRADPPAEFRAFFGVDVEFGADVDEIVFPASVASLPLVGRDPYLNELLRRYADQALASRTREGKSLRSDVERILPQLLPHGRARVPEVARQLGMSARTLSRKLHEQDMAFGDILDDLRAALAKYYLGDREVPVSEIAWLLGYQEVSSLTHAFRRWTGMTPKQFRSSEFRRKVRTSGRAAHRALAKPERRGRTQRK